MKLPFSFTVKDVSISPPCNPIKERLWSHFLGSLRGGEPEEVVDAMDPEGAGAKDGVP
jgi:hypothetical protein